ncbi:MAG: helix-hairpin-helix domain-containing protein [Geobacteraceae bacterium]|nr:helix-hairpin-helix domain-containing protein [Geobacteraceae bacterium]
MSERHHRFVLCIVALVLALMLMAKSRGIFRWEDTPALFLPEGTPPSGKVTIRIDGNVVNPGIYQYRHAADTKTVMKMTVAGQDACSEEDSFLNHGINIGDVVWVARKKGNLLEIEKKSMSTSEKMILGIPLNPNKMTVEDWVKLPGIGPATAERIVEDRQNNGDIVNLEELDRVPGIGKAKIGQVKKYFKN